MPPGIFLLILLGGIGSSWICIISTEMGRSSSKGSLPVIISYIIMPKE